jgi:hypothetical protein
MSIFVFWRKFWSICDHKLSGNLSGTIKISPNLTLCHSYDRDPPPQQPRPVHIPSAKDPVPPRAINPAPNRAPVSIFIPPLLPGVLSSGAIRTPRSGSSPYQKIHSSFDVERLRGGGGGGPGSNMSVERGVGTRRHTHRMSASRQRA